MLEHVQVVVVVLEHSLAREQLGDQARHVLVSERRRQHHRFHDARDGFIGLDDLAQFAGSGPLHGLARDPASRLDV